MNDHERYSAWDAAYALGALSASDRAEFERHLAQCDLCRWAVAELGSTVSLLSLLDADDAERLTDADEAAPVRVLAAARERHRRRRRLAAWIGGAAAAVVVATVISVGMLMPRPAEALVLHPVDGAPVAASVTMTSVPWGTKLDVVCEYTGGSAYGTTGEYSLVVVDAAGTSTPLSNWAVRPGATARLSAGTALGETDISAIEIRDARGTTVVRHEFD